MTDRAALAALRNAVREGAARRVRSTMATSNAIRFRGVEWDGERKKYRARIEPAGGGRGRWLGRYETAEEAARAYDEAAREIYGEHAYLNFPNHDEKRVKLHRVEDDGRCVNGHDLAEFAYPRPDGRGWNCRACNREAAKRSYNRKKACREKIQEAKE